MNEAPDSSRTSATWLSGTCTTVPFAPGTPTVMRRIASRLERYSGASRTTIAKLRSLPSSYRLPAAWPPMAACTVALMSPGARP